MKTEIIVLLNIKSYYINIVLTSDMFDLVSRQTKIFSGALPDRDQKKQTKNIQTENLAFSFINPCVAGLTLGS